MPRSASSCLLSWPSRLLVALSRAALWGARFAALLCSVLPLCTSPVFSRSSEENRVTGDVLRLARFMVWKLGIRAQLPFEGKSALLEDARRGAVLAMAERESRRIPMR